MADSFNERVVFEFDLTDATKATDLVKGLQRALAQTTSEFPKVEQGLAKMGNTAATSAQRAKREYSALGEQVYTLSQNYSRLETAASRASANMQNAMRQSSQYYKDANAGAEALARNLEKAFGSTTGGYQPTTFGKIANEGAEAAKRTAQYYRDASQSAARLAGNLEKTFGPQGSGGYRPSTFGQLFGDDYRATEQASRGYLNLSTAIDSSIDARKRESAAFSQSLQAKMREDVANDRLSKSTNSLASGSLPRLRYALYDVATTAGVLGAAFLGLDAAILKTAIDFERQFADVARTSGVTGSAFAALRNQFTNLAQTLPVAFSDLTKIGSIAAQLNIGAESLAAFTSIVARFSATTNISAEQSAMALGRLAQLLPDVQGNYEALASSILKVGVNSIATESQIVSIATQIAGIGTQSGLSADEVVGLSAALASVGIQPELSRGMVTRLFTNIQVAISQAGDRLEDFGRISGMTGAQFAASWSSDAGGALLDLLEGIRVNGGASVETIRALGITSVRDLPALQKLAQNADLVAESFGYSAEGMRDATEVALQYRVIAETVASRIKQLGNNIQVLFDSMGSAVTGPLAGLIDFLNQAVISIDAFISTPAGQVISTIGVALIGLVGAMASLIATAALAGASIAAVSTALTAVGASAGFATAAINVLKVALISTGIGAAIVVLGGIAAALIGASGAFDDAGTKARKYFGDMTNLGSALRRDTEIYERTGQAIYTIADAQDTAADAAKRATLAYGENAKAALASMLAANKNFQQLVTQIRDGDFGGVDEEVLTRMLLGEDPEGQARAYIQKFVDAAKEEATNAARAVQSGSGAGLALDVAKIDDQYRPLFDLITVTTGAISDQADEFFALQTAANAAGVGVEELTGDQIDLTSALKESIDLIFEVPNATRSAEDALSAMGKEFAESGAMAAFGGKGVQDYISSVIDLYGPTPAAADAVQVLINSLIASGYAASAAAPELQYLNQVVAVLGGSAAKYTTDLSGFSGAMERTGSSASSASEKVRTLVDYANDLAGVFSRSFDIRFAPTAAIDALADSFQSLTDRIAEARREIQGLQAQRGQLDYFLMVAENYGDTLRAAALRAEIAELNAKIADTEADASTELKGNTKAGRANRKAITDLLKQYESYITALAASGADQATLNAAVAQSRSDFLAQAQALGFSGAELQQYASHFDDLTTSINRVPRDITVEANVDPALQALNEFEAKAAAAGSSAGRAFGSGISQGMSEGLARLGRATELQSRIAELQQQYSIASAGGYSYGASRIMSEINTLGWRLANGQYYRGGYTGRGGMYEPAGVVHRGEYVIPQRGVDQSTGLPRPEYVAQLTRGSSGNNGGYATGGYARGNSGPMLVQLVASDLHRLASGQPIVLNVDGKQLAATVNGTNQMTALRGGN